MCIEVDEVGRPPSGGLQASSEAERAGRAEQPEDVVGAQNQKNGEKGRGGAGRWPGVRPLRPALECLTVEMPSFPGEQQELLYLPSWGEFVLEISLVLVRAGLGGSCSTWGCVLIWSQIGPRGETHEPGDILTQIITLLPTTVL